MAQLSGGLYVLLAACRECVVLLAQLILIWLRIITSLEGCTKELKDVHDKVAKEQVNLLTVPDSIAATITVAQKWTLRAKSRLQQEKKDEALKQKKLDEAVKTAAEAAANATK